MISTNPKVDEFISSAKKWKSEFEELRAIVLGCNLTEEFKWRQPCYTFRNGNILLLAGFKEHCAISFLKGVLLNDTEGILVSPGENSQSVKFIKFNNINNIIDMKPVIKAYVFEAMEIEKSGLKVDLSKSKNLVFPKELLKKLDEDADFRNAFNALTPGRQRGYNLYFSATKNSKTRETRIDKYAQRILDGKGIHDCVCGLSEKMPRCDGSHKSIRS